MGFKQILQAAMSGYASPSNRKGCERCEGAGVLFTRQGSQVECDECLGDGWVHIVSPFSSFDSGAAVGGFTPRPDARPFGVMAETLNRSLKVTR